MRPAATYAYLIAAALLAVLATAAQSGASTGLLSGHSHWDDPNANYEIQACYDVLANVTGAGSMIGHIPFREQDAKNFYDLDIRTDGFALQ